MDRSALARVSWSLLVVAVLAAASMTLAVRAEASGSRISASALVGDRAGGSASVVPLVVCPTSFGVAPAKQPIIPKRVRLGVASGLADRVAAYTDREEYLTVVAPRGWRCTATYGADGSGGLRVTPAAAAGSSAEAVVADETSVCFSCTNGQACALFSSAAAAYRAAYRSPCPVHRPPREAVVPLSAALVAFEDPPSVKGDGNPSGGLLPANGVMTYLAGSPQPSFLETCTLPQDEHSLCTTILNDFIARYGRH